MEIQEAVAVCELNSTLPSTPKFIPLKETMAACFGKLAGCNAVTTGASIDKEKLAIPLKVPCCILERTTRGSCTWTPLLEVQIAGES
jgi:hypothetical protein